MGRKIQEEQDILCKRRDEIKDTKDKGIKLNDAKAKASDLHGT